MNIFYLIIFGLPVLGLFWWWGTDRVVRRLPRPRLWRTGIAVFALAHLASYAWVITARRVPEFAAAPTTLLTAAYTWHLVLLGPALITTLAALIIAPRSKRAANTRTDEPAGAQPAPAAAPQPVPALSRRQFLAGALAVTPPALQGITIIRSIDSLDHFRIRALDVPIANLPAELDGLRIAHITDIHVGRFTNGRVLKEIARATNDLRADCVAVTGDIIDYALKDLPAAADILRAMDAPGGVHVCEGNHDLFQGREGFESGLYERGVNLLVNQAESVTLRGRPVQFLGLKWGGAESRRDANTAANLEALRPLRDPEAFQILLAHHPHAFDDAVAEGIPLTLAGHTHGGQLMASEGLGAGPLMFRYWSGLYQSRLGALAVSNGVGNWFPLRLNAPAEILDITLRRA